MTGRPSPDLWTPDRQYIRLGRSFGADLTNPLIMEIGGKLHAVFLQGGEWPPHALIVGSTRGGKTSAMRYFITGLLLLAGDRAEIHLADGKFSGAFKMFRDRPSVVDVANTADEVAEMVFGFRNDVDARYRDLDESMERVLKTGKADDRYVEPAPAWLILDDYFNWMLRLPEGSRGEVIDALIQIGSIGGEVDSHLWLATQRPDSAKTIDAGLPSLLKAQLKVRIAQVGIPGMDSIESRMAFDDAEVAKWLQAEADRAKLRDRRGLGVIRVGGFTVAYKVPWMANPLHPRTSAKDREAALRLLPAVVADTAELDIGGDTNGMAA